MADQIVKLKDRGRGFVLLTVRNGVVVGAMGSEPKRFMDLPIEAARYIAKHGGTGERARAPAGPRSYEEDMADLARKHAGVVRGGSLRSGHAPVAPKMQDAHRAKAFDLDKAETYRALQDARAYVTDFDRNGRKAEALYKRLDRAGRVMRPWSTAGTIAQRNKAIEYLNEITSILSDKIGPASRREFPEQRK